MARNRPRCRARLGSASFDPEPNPEFRRRVTTLVPSFPAPAGAFTAPPWRTGRWRRTVAMVESRVTIDGAFAMSRRLPALFLPLALACLAPVALAQSPTPAPEKSATASGAITPGTYDLEILYGGGVLPGVLTLAPAGDSLAASLKVGDHASPITSITRRGATLLLGGGSEGFKLSYELRFNGDAVTGTFTFNGDTGELAGKRRR